MAILRKLLTATAVATLFFPHWAQAAKFRDFDNYRVHYSAFNSTIIAPEIARAYGLNRSDYRGILNITVQRKEGSVPYPGTDAEITARATNLTDQTKVIDMQRIEEGEAIYYIGEFPVSNQEVLNFEVDVRPAASDRNYRLNFRQQFFTSERE